MCYDEPPLTLIIEAGSLSCMISEWRTHANFILLSKSLSFSFPTHIADTKALAAFFHNRSFSNLTALLSNPHQSPLHAACMASGWVTVTHYRNPTTLCELDIKT